MGKFTGSVLAVGLGQPGADHDPFSVDCDPIPGSGEASLALHEEAENGGVLGEGASLPTGCGQAGHGCGGEVDLGKEFTLAGGKAVPLCELSLGASFRPSSRR